jgi:hypothetical protein
MQRKVDQQFRPAFEIMSRTVALPEGWSEPSCLLNPWLNVWSEAARDFQLRQWASSKPA